MTIAASEGLSITTRQLTFKITNQQWHVHISLCFIRLWKKCFIIRIPLYFFLGTILHDTARETWTFIYLVLHFLCCNKASSKVYFFPQSTKKSLILGSIKRTLLFLLLSDIKNRRWQWASCCFMWMCYNLMMSNSAAAAAEYNAVVQMPLRTQCENNHTCSPCLFFQL